MNRPGKRIRMRVPHVQLHESGRLAGFAANRAFFEEKLLLSGTGAAAAAAATTDAAAPIATVGRDHVILVISFVL